MFNIINKNNELDIRMQKNLGETEPTKELTWRDYIVEGCGEFAVQLALLAHRGVVIGCQCAERHRA